jgi:16S rRNA (guanine527-N7)-methyltransferase
VTPREILISGTKELGIDLSAGQVNSVFIYLTELKKWNRKINLTAIREERDIVIKHVLDSLSYTSGFIPERGLKLMDMGSGAGFPALPIKIAYSGIAVTLVESVKKKAAFLRHVIRTLKLEGAEVIDMRTNELSDPFLAAYDVVTARAFAEMSSALETGRPFLKKGGLLVLSRGPQESVADPVLAGAEVTVEKRIELTLPHSEYRRVIWVFKKIA